MARIVVSGSRWRAECAEGKGPAEVGDAIRNSLNSFDSVVSSCSFLPATTMDAAAPTVFSTSAIAFSGGISITALVILSAVMPLFAITVTLRRPVMPRPVFGSTMCE
jgi:hypothetical protein